MYKVFNKSIKICLIHLVERERERDRDRERERERKKEVKFPVVEFYFRKNPIVKKRINIRRTQIYFNILSFL